MPKVTYATIQPHLNHAEYIISKCNQSFTVPQNTHIRINDLSMVRGNGHGTYSIVLSLAINNSAKKFTYTHHNEDWLDSQKLVYDPSMADSEEELEQAFLNFQHAYEAVIDANIEEIESFILQN